jgi:hypothetical protein
MGLLYACHAMNAHKENEGSEGEDYVKSLQNINLKLDHARFLTFSSDITATYTTTQFSEIITQENKPCSHISLFYGVASYVDIMQCEMGNSIWMINNKSHADGSVTFVNDRRMGKLLSLQTFISQS